MHVLCIIYSLQAGGAERVLSILTKAWVEQGDAVTLLTLEDGKQRPFYPVDTRVKTIALDLASPSRGPIAALGNNIRRVRGLRRAIAANDPDVVISFLTETNVLALLATLGMKVPVFACEHTDPFLCPIGRAWEWMRRLTYPQAIRVVLLSERAREYFSGNVHTITIPNPVLVPPEKVAAKCLRNSRLIVAMGRLAVEKRFDLLIHAFAKLTDRYPDWSLKILGEGPQREKLEALCEELGLGECVQLPGNVSDPHTVLARAAVFVSSSMLEGFPMAVCEAMACGLPVIVAEYHTGIHEIIQDGDNGVIVPAGNITVLTAAIERLLEAPEARVELGAQAGRITERFGIASVLHRWSKLLSEATATK